MKIKTAKIIFLKKFSIALVEIKGITKRYEDRLLGSM